MAMTARTAWRLAAVTATAIVVSVPVMAASARLERVVLLPAGDRSSVVFELSAEPLKVSTRRISDSVFEVEAGPGIDSAVPQMLKAPANVRFIDSVAVRVTPTEAGSMVRARITMTAAAQAVVRSAGRRVYVDVSPAPAVAAAAPALQAASTRPAAPAATTRPTADRPAKEDGYQVAVRPVVGKLKELGPFLTSAASSADPGVTNAILPSLVTLRGSFAALQPTDQARGSHVMVLAAVDKILRAFSPDYTGDRASAVKQSITTIDVVGGVLAGE
jgi:hypothetical protein